MSALARNNVTVGGSGERTIVFAHGLGCDQNMWRFVEPAFATDFRTVLFDNVGAGRSDLSAYTRDRYGSLSAYADDLVEIGHELGVSGGILVGHSVGALIGLLASLMAPEMFDTLILVGPSPRYIDDEGYSGGFTGEQIEELLEFLASDHLAWSNTMAPVIMGNPGRPELSSELATSFCRSDPEIARHFARLTFTSDNRGDLRAVKARTLIMQCRDDVIAPSSVGMYCRDNIPGSELVLLEATGHCPNLSAPDEVVAAIRAFV